MMDQYTKDFVQLLTQSGQFLLLLISAGWAYLRLWREGVLRPRVEFRVDCRFYDPHSDAVITEILLYAKNQGLVKHEVDSIKLRIRGIKAGSVPQFWEKYEPRLQFPEKLIEAEVVHKEKYGHIFVEPGVDQLITYVTRLPRGIKFIVIRAEFRYAHRRRHLTHSAERVFEIQDTETSTKPVGVG